MNENQDYEKSLDDAVERRVHGKKASGNPMLDALGQIKPEADPAFMNHLEERLMAELSTKKTKKELAMLKRKERPSRFGRWPLTIAAAVIAILLVGAWILYADQKPMQTASSAPSQVMNPVQGLVATQDLFAGRTLQASMIEVRTFTPDPLLDQDLLITEERLAIGMVVGEFIPAGEPVLRSSLNQQVPVVIAIQDIPAGTEITPDRVGVIMFPADSAPRGAFESIEAVVGFYAKTNIYMEEVVLARKIAETPNEADPSLECPEQGLPHGIYMVQEGDTMMSISVSTGHSVQDILAMNCMESAEFDDIYVGEILLIPLLSTVSDLGSNGCDSYTSLDTPYHAQIISEPITIEGIVSGENFGEAKLEISGPSTDNQFVVLATIPDEIETTSDFGQFVPANYAEGEYLFRLTSFDTSGTQIGIPCTKIVYISHGAYPPVFTSVNTEDNITAGMTPVVIALQDIPMSTTVTSEMVALVYWPNNVATDYTATHPGQWPSDSLDDVIGKNSTVLFPAFEPISRDDLSTSFGCNPETESCGYPIPDGYVSLIYQTTDLAIMNFPTGAHVDVVTAMLFSDIENAVLACQGCEAGTNLVMQRTISDAIILYKELIHPDGSQGVVATLAVHEQEANVLLWMSEAGLPIMLVPHMEGTETSVAQYQSINAVEAPYYVAIPINQIESLEYGIMTGDTVTVYLNNSEMSFGGVVSYIGDSQYAPADMQTAVESITQGNKDVLVLAVSSADIVAATNDYAALGLRFEMVRLSSSGGTAAASQQFPTNAQWFDASALSFNVGDNVDVIAQFTYLDENGEPAGMIRQRLGVDMIITSMEAGTGDSAAYALVGLTEQNLEAGQMLASFQTCCHGTGTTQVLESWILVPYNPNLPAATEYFVYNQRGEPVPLEADSLAEGHYYAAMPLLHMVQSVAGGLTEGDNITLIFTDGSSIEGQISYIGSALYAPFSMQVSVDNLRAESPRSIIVEVSSPEEAAAISAHVEAGESITIDVQR